MTRHEAELLAQEKYPIKDPNCVTERFFKMNMRKEYVEKLLNEKKITDWQDVPGQPDSFRIQVSEDAGKTWKEIECKVGSLDGLDGSIQSSRD
jgi:hypothetical protein